MPVSLIMLLIGGLMLYLGAEWMVKGGSNLAGRLGISPLVIGLTVVAFGTSFPELMVSAVAAINDSESIAIGNVIGSNVANIGLVLGLSSLIFPITVVYSTIIREIWIYLGVAVVFTLFCLNGMIERWEGIVLFLGLIGYMRLHIKHPPEDTEAPLEDFTTIPRSLGLLIAGIAVLTWGADLFVDGAVRIATILGITEVVIGMTIVALGTSLPEFATSLVAAFRKQNGISIGNIVGSNLFNILSVIGIVGIIRPLNVERDILTMEIPLMLIFGFALIPVAKMKQPIPRLTSMILFFGYIAMMVWIFIK